jgi:hypothetical protein
MPGGFELGDGADLHRIAAKARSRIAVDCGDDARRRLRARQQLRAAAWLVRSKAYCRSSREHSSLERALTRLLDRQRRREAAPTASRRSSTQSKRSSRKLAVRIPQCRAHADQYANASLRIEMPDTTRARHISGLARALESRLAPILRDRPACRRRGQRRRARAG